MREPGRRAAAAGRSRAPAAGRAAGGTAPAGAAVTAAPPFDVAVVFQAASLLLDYPDAGGETLAGVIDAVHELPRGEARRRLQRFLQWWQGLAPRDREARYVETFELGGPASLYLTHAGIADKRHRGQHLLRLQAAYCGSGWQTRTNELPDYLPLMLEFAAREALGMNLLAAESVKLERLAGVLGSAGSPFSDVVDAVRAALGTAKPGKKGPVS